MRVRIIETSQKGEGMSSYAAYKVQTKVLFACVAHADAPDKHSWLLIPRVCRRASL